MSPPTPRLRRALLVLTAALAALLCALTPLPAAADTAPADWTARPAGGGGDREARPYVYLEGTPGTALQDRLAVTNSGRAPLTVRLRGDGRAGAWIGFAADTVTVPARTRAEVPLALTVPPDAVPGDAAGEVVADDGEKEIRVPVRVRIGGPTLAALTVEDVEISGGTIRYALVNRGNAMLAPRLAVRADGVFGTLLDRPERPLPLELAPGRRVERTEPWPDAPALDAVTVRLRVTAQGGAGDEAEASATYIPVAPAVGGGLLVLGGLALLGSGAYRRRRTRLGARGPSDTPDTPAGPESPDSEAADDSQPATETRALGAVGTPGEGGTPGEDGGEIVTQEPAAQASRRTPSPVLLFLAALLALLPALFVLPAPVARAADGDPTVSLSKKEAGKGGEITVSGSGWRADTLLMLLICGQSTPERGVIGGTNSCANADGCAVTTDKKGAFSKKLPVAEPPKPCPCVVHVATVTGEQALADAVFTVAGHPTTDLPKQTGDGKLAVLATTRLEGDSSLLTWFGAPPARRLVFTVGNLGSAPVEDPVFEIGTAHGVYAPQWEERQWRGTVAPGGKAQIKLPVELSAGAHGDYQVSLRYGKKVLAEQPWGVGRPWGVTLFWILLCLVVPAAVFRIGMAVVDKVRPRPAGSHRTRTPARRRKPKPRGHRGTNARQDATTATSVTTDATTATKATTAVLPWFTPDSAPSENRPFLKTDQE